MASEKIKKLVENTAIAKKLEEMKSTKEIENIFRENGIELTNSELDELSRVEYGEMGENALEEVIGGVKSTKSLYCTKCGITFGTIWGAVSHEMRHSRENKDDSHIWELIN